MSLGPGTRLGVYQVTALIGAGGMGEVYRATDTALEREVAIKVLPEALAQDADRLARLEREARTLASLNHPNIAAIHGLERTKGTCALVMELVDGVTLAERLSLGAIAVDEALPIARQIAEALEVAHERGIIHRDLKPGNIKIRSDGTVKVLDFGLAKPTESAAAPSGGSYAPTITTPAMTQHGVILGTAAYMSPEQARGSPVDKRADVWSFGVVLYEMVSGRRLFNEDTVSDTLASVLKSDVKLEGLPGDLPGRVRRVIERCLTRDLRRRLRDIGEARIAIEDVLVDPGGDSVGESWPSRAERRPFWRRALPWALAAMATAIAGLFVWAPWRSAPTPTPVMHLVSNMGTDIRLALNTGSNVVLSPDGTLVALMGSPSGTDRPRMFVRRLDQLEATELPGTEGARDAFFSPDGQSIGFFADGKLKRIPSAGGAALTLCDAPDDRGGSWSDDGWIVFSPQAGESPLFRVSADGGMPEALTSLGSGEVTHRWPHVLPGGRAVLYTASNATGNYEQASVVLRSLVSGEVTTVHRGGYYARFLSTGHLVYISRGSLFAVRFNLERLTVESAPSLILEHVATSPTTGGAQFSISPNGSLAYVLSPGEAANPSIFWLNGDGRTQPLRSVPAAYEAIRFSPDGQRLATVIGNPSDIWTYEWGRDLLSRVTSDQALDANPVWSPDGRRIAFRSARDGVDNLYWQQSDGTGEARRLTDSKVGQWMKAWHPGGTFLAYEEVGHKRDVWILPVDASTGETGAARAFLEGPFSEVEPDFSPDGRWLAYASDESGRTEVYVTPFPGPGDRVRVSATGGSFPRWSSKLRELFYLGADGKVMVAAYSTSDGAFRPDKPRAWSDVAVMAFDVHPDGKRVAVLKADSPTSDRATVVFVVNFFDEVRRRLTVN